MAKSPKVWLPKLKAQDENVRKSARRYFCSFTPKDKAAVPDLIETLESGDSVFGYWAARALSGIGPEAKGAVPALITTLGSDDPDVRFWAVTALSSIGSEAKGAIPMLIDLFQDPVFGVRQAVADALVRIDPTGSPVISMLVNVLKKDESKWVRQKIVQMLGHTESPRAVPALAEALADQDPDVRRYAVIALKVLGPAAKEAIPAIKAFLTTCDAGTEIRIQAEAALKSTGMT